MLIMKLSYQNEGVPKSYTVISSRNIVEDSEDMEEYWWPQEPPRYGEQFTRNEQNDLNQLLQQFPKIISGKSGRTTTAQHKIITDGSRPIWQWPYQIPPPVIREVSEELNRMLKDELRIIQQWVVITNCHHEEKRSKQSNLCGLSQA